MRPPATLNEAKAPQIWSDIFQWSQWLNVKGQLLMLLHGVWLHLKGQIHLSDFKVIWNAVYKCFYKLLSCWKSTASKPPPAGETAGDRECETPLIDYNELVTSWRTLGWLICQIRHFVPHWWRSLLEERCGSSPGWAAASGRMVWI